MILRTSTILGIVLFAGCATVPRGPRLPIALLNGSSPLVLEMPKVELSKGRVIGKDVNLVSVAIRWPDDLKIDGDQVLKAMAPEMKKLGYHVVESINSSDRMPRYHLVGSVSTIQYDVFGKLSGDYSEININVTWKLVAPGNRLLYTYQTAGSYREKGRPPGRNLFKNAYLQSFRDLLSEPAFVVFLELKEDTGPSPYLSNSDAIPAAPCHISAPVEASSALVRMQVGSIVSSGFLLSPDGIVITGSNILSGLYTIPIFLPNGKEVRAKILRIDRTMQIAVLKVPGADHACLPVTQETLQADLPAVFSGHARSNQKVAVGSITAKVKTSKLGNAYVEPVDSIPSSYSGGPVHTLEGRALGMLAQPMLSNPSYLVGLPMSDVLARLNIFLLP